MSGRVLTLHLQLKPSPQAALQRIPERRECDKKDCREGNRGGELKDGGTAFIILCILLIVTCINSGPKGNSAVYGMEGVRKTVTRGNL